MREQCGDIRLADLGLVARDLEAHARLHVAQRAAQLALLRVLSEPAASHRWIGLAGSSKNQI